MKKISLGHFYGWLHNKKEHYPWNGQIELTYRCNLNCVHCYCKGLEVRVQDLVLGNRLSVIEKNKSQISNPEPRVGRAENRNPQTKKRELTTTEWKKILDQIQKEGCIWLTLTGGEPLIRDDFLEIYSYAKAKGFIITIFSNGLLLTKGIISYLQKSPPAFIEITLNGITETVYESITQVKGSFKKIISVIKELIDKKLPLILKSNCLKQNKNEIGRIKTFTDELLGKAEGKYYFKYDPMIYPRLNGDKTPCSYRLSFEELLEVRSSEPEIWQEYEKGLCADFPDLGRDKDFLYRCNTWRSNFFINPYGRLKFCQFSERFSADLKKMSFKEGFYNIFPQLLNERFKTDSKCHDCHLRPICYHCPARVHLEIGDEEAPVPYYCELAKETAKQIQVDYKRL